MSTSSRNRRQNPYLPHENVVDNDVRGANPYQHCLTVKESTPVLLKCATGFPHKIKFRKKVRSVYVRLAA